jgi:hypothetical protein
MVYISQSEKNIKSAIEQKSQLSQDLFWFFILGQGGQQTLSWKVSL